MFYTCVSRRLETLTESVGLSSYSTMELEKKCFKSIGHDIVLI